MKEIFQNTMSALNSEKAQAAVLATCGVMLVATSVVTLFRSGKVVPNVSIDAEGMRFSAV